MKGRVGCEEMVSRTKGKEGVEGERASHDENLYTWRHWVSVAQGCIDDLHMQELKVWRSFLHLPHRQGSYDMPMLSKRFPYPLKKLSLSGILCGVTQKNCSLR
jgi:hypothetical protein